MSLDVYLSKVMPVNVFDQNITHNLGKMADAAGIYEVVWRPEECGILKAADLIPHLERGIEKMEADPEAFRKLESPNGWGTYNDFVPWLRRYLEACREHPDADVYASR